MKKICLLSVMLLWLLLCWCWKAEIKEAENKEVDTEEGEFYTEEMVEYVNWLLEEQRENLHNITYSGVNGKLNPDLYIVRNYLTNKWKLDYNYSGQEIKDIIAAHIWRNLDSDFMLNYDYLSLKKKVKDDLPQYSDEIDEYFALPRKDEFFELTHEKKTFHCYWYKVAAFMSEWIDHHEWFMKPDGLVNWEIDDNNQNFTIKINTENDTLEFYSDLTPWEGTIYKLLRNNDRSIIAEDWDMGRNLLQSITISKITWLWIWTKINASWMPAYWEIPYWIMTYIYCDNAL